MLFMEDELGPALAFWYRREVFHHMVINGQIGNLGDYFAQRGHLETE